MDRIKTLLAAAVFTVATTAFLQAQCDQCSTGCASCAATNCCSAPACQAAGHCCGGPRCVGTAELVDVEKHCWEIECEDVCIPAVRFPWEHGGNKLTLFSLFHCNKGCGKSGCTDRGCTGCSTAPSCGCAGAGCNTCVPPKCGFVVRVRDLKKKTYDTQVCEYSIGLADPSHDGCCDQCTTPGCEGCSAAPAYDLAPQQQLTPHYEAAPKISPVAPAAPQPVPAAPPTVKNHSTKDKLNFVSLKKRLFGNTSRK